METVINIKLSQALKAAKVGDAIIADNVGLSGLKSNTIKVRK